MIDFASSIVTLAVKVKFIEISIKQVIYFESSNVSLTVEVKNTIEAQM